MSGANAGVRVPGRALFLLFCLCFSAYGLTFQGVRNWNAVSRFALTLSIVRSGTVTIDEYAALTGDKAATPDGHFASDKAPGLSLLAVPATAIADRITRALGSDRRLVAVISIGGEELHTTFPLFGVLIRIATVSTVGLISALAAVAFCDLLTRLGVAPRRSLLFAIVFGLATPQWGWSTVFFGHAIAGAFLILALWAIERLTAPADRFRGALAVLTGAFLGLAVLTELTTAPAAAILGLLALWRFRHQPLARIGAATALALAGAAVPLAVLGAYNMVVFGGPLRLGYASVVGFEGMATGLFGVGLPRPGVIFALLLGGRRGLLWLAPIVVLFPWALFVAGRRRPDVTVASAAIVATYFLINAGYGYWDGGWSTGPRHLIPAMAFIILPIALASDALQSAWTKGLVLVLALAGIAVNLLAVTTDMATPPHVRGVVVFTHLIPVLLSNGPQYLHLPLGDPWLELGAYVGLLGALTFATMRSLPAVPLRSPPGQAERPA